MIPSASGIGQQLASASFPPPTPTTLTSPYAQTDGFFGSSVAISGTTVVVGAPQEAAFGFDYAGHVYVVNTKTDLATVFSSPNPQWEGFFGSSVAISGTTLVVGAPGENASGYGGAGHVYLINTGTGVATVLSSPNPRDGGNFGSSVAISGTTVVVGAPNEEAYGYILEGHAYIINLGTGVETVLTSPLLGAYFGASVAISGTTVAVGAPGDPASGYDEAGDVFLFNATTGAPIVTLTSPYAQTYGYFGSSVGISGTILVAGAPGENASGWADAGNAYTFSATTGALISSLTSPNAQKVGYFGTSVAISGTTAVVGAPDENASGYHDAGNAYTLSASSGALISANTTFESPNPQTERDFGVSVAISGTTLVVGAPAETVAGQTDAGHAYVFTDLPLTFTSSNAQVVGDFGYSVAVSGTTVVVGTPYETASGYGDGGHAYLINTATWVETVLTSPNVQTRGDFGYSVAISGTTVVVGAPYENASGYADAGHAYMFNAKTGDLISTFTSPHAQTDGYFGWSVAISGTTVVVGAPHEKASGDKKAGRAYTFSATTGGLISTLTSPNAQKSGYFGVSVAISGTTAVVGATGETASGYVDAGHAYAFSAKTAALISTLTSPNAQTDGYFGASVAISGTTVVVGAPGETASGFTYAGNAYTFSATTGALISSLTSPNAQKVGYFGTSVAISGTTVVVGAWAETASGYINAGRAYAFNATTGALIISLTSPNVQASGAFGYSVAISGTSVVIGAFDESASGYHGAGHAYLF